MVLVEAAVAATVTVLGL